MASTQSTLGLYMAYANSIESVHIRAWAKENSVLKFSVWIPDAHGSKTKGLKIYSSEVHLLQTKGFRHVELPINLYTDSPEFCIEIMDNPCVELDEDSFEEKCLKVIK